MNRFTNKHHRDLRHPPKKRTKTMDKATNILVELLQQVDEDCPQDNRSDHLLNVMDDAQEFIDHNKKDWVFGWVHEIATEMVEAMGWEALRGLKEEDVAFSLGEDTCNDSRFLKEWKQAGEPVYRTAIERILIRGNYSAEDTVDKLKEQE